MTDSYPRDRDVVARMRSAHHRARTALNVQSVPNGREAWGWRGRTLSQPVTCSGGRAWLRLAAEPCEQTNTTFWNGSRDSTDAIPTIVPRPHLREIHDWKDDEWRYRAELYDYVEDPPVASSAILTTPPVLPPHWWSDLRTALTAVETVSTSRHSTDQQYLDWAMPKFLGPVDTQVPCWTTAHGDLHWANLCIPRLTVLDWEGWGLAPIGYDAATLHSYSLLVPELADRVRSELAAKLDTQAGRFAELVVIAELLESTTHGHNLPLHGPLRNRAAHLLGREIP